MRNQRTERSEEEESIMTNTHTPTPWFVDDGSEKGDKTYILGPGGCYIAQLDDSEDDPYGDDLKANATYIVRAVNSYEDLIAGLHAAVVRLDSGKEVERAFNANLVKYCRGILEKAKANAKTTDQGKAVQS
jgi:hypothetical protein